MDRAETSELRSQKNIGNDVDQNKVKELAVRGEDKFGFLTEENFQVTINDVSVGTTTKK